MLNAYEESGAWKNEMVEVLAFFIPISKYFFSLADNTCSHQYRPTKEKNIIRVNLG